jgi:galactose mutarotase-like enzyme
MKRHGFLRNTELSVEIHTEEMAVFSMADSEITRSQYPFSFRLLLQYRLTGRMLQIIYSVENRDEKAMYFGVGGHPGFCVPLEKGLKFEDYYLEFSEQCEPQQILFSDACLVLDKTVPYLLENNKKIALRHELFDSDALILKNATHSVTLKSDKSKHMITVQYPDMQYIGFWHKPHSDAGYVCIEPWSSLPAREEGITDLEKQQDLVRLESGKLYENRWSISCF